ncbi:MAG: hypothetical protein WKF70_10760 [Chitinophagaceae bacterium]
MKGALHGSQKSIHLAHRLAFKTGNQNGKINVRVCAYTATHSRNLNPESAPLMKAIGVSAFYCTMGYAVIVRRNLGWKRLI